MRNLQQAADDVGVIAETVRSLITLLDRFHAIHGEETYERLAAAWPDAGEIGGVDALFKLARDLTPPD